MIDNLYAYAYPAQESFTTPGSIWTYDANNTALCMDVQWGDSDSGTPVWLWPCSYGKAQTWQYDRSKGTIYNPAYDKCLDVSHASTDTGARLQIWTCNGTDAQRWTWDPKTGVLQNALGTVLDIDGRSAAKRARLVTWDRDQSTSQRWRFPDIWDALAGCQVRGTC
jgi:glucosylceramidase